MIAKDTKHRFVDELEFDVRNEERWREILRGEQIVVQAPCMLKEVVDNPPPGIFIVLMRRDLTKIHASEHRIGWDQMPDGNALELEKFGLAGGDSAGAKYDYWESHEKMVPFLELEYESLREHPLFIADHRRRNFSALQTSNARLKPLMSLAIMLGRRWQRFLPLSGRVHRHGPDRRLPQ